MSSADNTRRAIRRIINRMDDAERLGVILRRAVTMELEAHREAESKKPEETKAKT